MKLLGTENAKTSKGFALGWLTGILYLAPGTLAGVGNVCRFASELCLAACLYSAGRGAFSSVQIARIRKTRMLFERPAEFYETLASDIRALVKRAKSLGVTPCVRLNGTSDLPRLSAKMSNEIPQCQLYDYTKVPRPWERSRANYHITFSLSESNETEAGDALRHGVNVAVVFSTKRGHDLPRWYTIDGLVRPVIDGDVTDLRFLDPTVPAGLNPAALGYIIGLRAKGKARGQSNGFIRYGIEPSTAEHDAKVNS